MADTVYFRCQHSRKPDEIFDIVESCSPAPYLELFARFPRLGWSQWGNEDVEENHSSGVALRNGHIEPSLRLVGPPRNYRGDTAVKDDPVESFEEMASRRAA